MANIVPIVIFFQRDPSQVMKIVMRKQRVDARILKESPMKMTIPLSTQQMISIRNLLKRPSAILIKYSIACMISQELHSKMQNSIKTYIFMTGRLLSSLWQFLL